MARLNFHLTPRRVVKGLEGGYRGWCKGRRVKVKVEAVMVVWGKMMTELTDVLLSSAEYSRKGRYR